MNPIAILVLSLVFLAACTSGPSNSQTALKAGFNDLGPYFKPGVQTRLLESGHLFIMGSPESSKDGISLQKVIVSPNGAIRRYEAQRIRFIRDEEGGFDSEVISGADQIIDILEDGTEVWSSYKSPSNRYLITPAGDRRSLQSYCGGDPIEFDTRTGKLEISRDGATVYRGILQPNPRLEKCASGKTMPIHVPLEGVHRFSALSKDGHSIQGYTNSDASSTRTIWLMDAEGSIKIIEGSIQKFFSANIYATNSGSRRDKKPDIISVNGKTFVPEPPSGSGWLHFRPWDITVGGASVGYLKFKSKQVELDVNQAKSVSLWPKMQPDLTLEWEDENWILAYWSPDTGIVPLAEHVGLPDGYRFTGDVHINAAGWIGGAVRTPEGTMNPYLYIPSPSS
ncbi:MAG: hypothetical protein QNI84_08460 [Henriciella sp.]|nr:hypothetical protein [Henriciella sp.]